MRPSLAGTALIALLASAVPALAPAAPARLVAARESHCGAGETVVYSCRFGRATGSVCAGPGRISYRFGPLGKTPELTVNSTPDWSNVHIGTIIGGGGGYQHHLRFSSAGHDYIVFEGVAGRLTEIPGKRWSGISVWRGPTEFPARACAVQTGGAPGALARARVLDFVPAASRDTIEENNKQFEAWF